MFKILSSQKDLTIDQNSSNQLKEQESQIQNVEFKKILNNDFFQFSQNQIFKSLTQTVRSHKSLYKNKLKNTLFLPKAVSIMNLNLKQDQLTAASLIDLELDFQPNQKLKRSSQKQNSISNLKQFSSMRSMNQSYQVFQDKYQTLQIIGQGAHSTVYKCKQKINNQLYALKKIKNISIQNQKKMKNFFLMIKSIKHPNILRHHQIYFNSQKRTAYILLEYCNYTDLKYQINKKIETNQKFKHQQIILILTQILLTLKYLHSEGICHRDIKPENILYNKLNHHIKVIDLDVCGVKKYKQEKFDLWTNTGTLFYRAPQTFGIGYNQKSDIWSLGIMLYQILMGKTPFQTQYEKDFINKISTTQINYQKLQTTKKIRYFMKSCLKKNIKQRSTASQLLNFLYSINKQQIKLIEIKQNIYCIKQKKNYYEQSDKQLICLGNLQKFILY